MANPFAQFLQAAGPPQSENPFSQFLTPAPAEDRPKSPKMSLTDALAEMWRNPPEGGLLKGVKSVVEGAKGPGLALQGAYSPQLETPGVLTEEDVFRQSKANEAAQDAARNLATGTVLSTAPGGAFAAPRGALGTGVARPPVAAPAAAAESTPGVLQAAGRIDVPIPKFLASDSLTTQRSAAGLRNVPIAGNKIIGATEGVVEGLGGAATKAAEGYGSASPELGGAAAKEAISGWMTDKSKDVTKRLYDAVDPLINQDYRRPLHATQEAVAEIMARRANAKIAGKSGAIDEVLGAVQAPEGMNYEGLKTLRSYIGELTPSQLVAKGVDQGESKRLYKALTEDLKGTILDAGGPKALTAFERANTVAKQVADRRQMLGKVIGVKGDAAPEAVYARLLAMAGSKSSADVGRLTVARKAMGPEAWDEFASGVVSKLGRDPQGNFSPDRFFTAYGNLSPQGRTSIFRSTGKDDLARSLEDINIVVNGVKDRISKFGNPSGTAQNVTAVSMLTGVLHSPLSTIGGLIGGNVMATALSKPATAKAIADLVKTDVRMQIRPGPGSQAAVRLAADRFAKALESIGISTQDQNGQSSQMQ